MLTKFMEDAKQYNIFAQLKVPTLNELEFIRRIKRELINKRKEIEAMKPGKRKKEAIEIYAELLTTLEFSDAS